MRFKHIGKEAYTTSALMNRLLALLIMLFSLNGNAADTHYNKEVKPILEKYCYRCHSNTKQKGDFNLEALDLDMTKGSDSEHWFEVLNNLYRGEMPPENKPQPTPKERQLVTKWLDGELKKAAASKKGEVATVIRRMNREQYTNSLKSLLGVNLNFGSVLPKDGISEEGFANNGNTLIMSPLHMDYFIKLARKALDETIFTEIPEVHHLKIDIARNIDPKNNGRFDLVYKAMPVKFTNYKITDLPPSIKGLKTHKSITTWPLREENGKITNYKGIKHAYYLDMRGSSKDSFKVRENGIYMKSSVPQRESGDALWHAPSPNLKIIMRDFPGKGNFKLTVRAFIPEFQPIKILRYANLKPLVSYDKKKGITKKKSLIISLKDLKNIKGCSIAEGLLIPEKKPSFVFNVKIAKSGYYQLDAIYTSDRNKNITLDVNGNSLTAIQAKRPQNYAKKEIIAASLALVYLNAGNNKFSMSGSFPFLKNFAITPISAQSKQAKAIADQKPNGEHPYMKAYAGSRTDDGMSYAEFGGIHKRERT